MPFLRFTRDKRGYESTYLVHTGRRRGKPRSRILYCYRTAPGVRIGRLPFDPNTIQLIEANNADLTFDWPKILQARPAPRREPKGETPARRRRRVSPAKEGEAGPTADRTVASDPVAEGGEAPRDQAGTEGSTRGRRRPRRAGKQRTDGGGTR